MVLLSLADFMERSRSWCCYAANTQVEDPMRWTTRCLVRGVSVFAIGLPLSCGGIGSQLESISISPSVASAQDSQKGQVQFVATGTYSDGRVVTPLSVIWGFHAPWIEIPDPGGVSIDSNGLAQCTAFKGTEPIVAIAPANPSVSLQMMNAGTRAVTATAHLTCQ